jgi:hypothetical protein
MIDISVSNHGTLVGLSPETPEGTVWLEVNLPEGTQRKGTTYFCEPRYALDIVNGAKADGLTLQSF